MPHQLCWGDGEMGTATSFIKCSQMADFNQMLCRTSSKLSSLHAAVFHAIVLHPTVYCVADVKTATVLSQLQVATTLRFEQLRILSGP